jgi:YesN/AraC family two-component response regulator
MYSILIVDDDDNLISGLKRSFRKKSEAWDIQYAKSAKEAVSLLELNKYDLIITDYKMPGMDGLDLLILVKEKYASVKRILLTGQSENEIFETSKDIAHVYLSKPCPADSIIEAIEKTLNLQ